MITLQRMQLSMAKGGWNWNNSGQQDTVGNTPKCTLCITYYVLNTEYVNTEYVNSFDWTI
jgi:hypothetical protein